MKYNHDYDPKYSIGDKVFHVLTTREKKKHDCPDCLGAQKWITTSPAGITYDFDCPRCCHSIALDYYFITYALRELTIGSVRIDTHDKNSPISYMCGETGVGSGSIYREISLYPTKETAELYGKQLAAKEIKQDGSYQEHFAKRLELSSYKLHLQE